MYHLFASDRIVLPTLLLNILVLFLLSFDGLERYFPIFESIDFGCTIFFLIEAVVKIRRYSWRGYITSHWNKLDFIIVLLTTPSLLIWFIPIPDFTFLLVLRAFRVAKFFRFLQFIPHLQDLLIGISRAMKASLFVLLGFFFYNLIVSLFTYYLFRDWAPKYFSNGFESFYIIFKIFTVEGWFEIPDAIAKNGAPWMSAATRLYFMLIVLTGGIFGISIVNAIFVEEMISNESEELEERLERVEQKLDLLLKKLEEKS